MTDTTEPVDLTLNERVLDIEARLTAIEHYLATNGA